MTDTTKCAGADCAKREYCERYTSEETPHQAWGAFYNEPRPCGYYLPNVKAIRWPK